MIELVLDLNRDFNFTNKELEERSGVDALTLWRMRERIVRPSEVTLSKTAKALCISPQEHARFKIDTDAVKIPSRAQVLGETTFAACLDRQADAIAHGRVKEAADCVHAMFELATRPAERCGAFLAAGGVYMAIGRYWEAKDCYEAASQGGHLSEKGLMSCKVNIARCYAKLNLSHFALLFTHNVSSDPAVRPYHLGWAHFVEAEVALAQHDLPKALAGFEAAATHFEAAHQARAAVAQDLSITGPTFSPEFQYCVAHLASVQARQGSADAILRLRRLHEDLMEDDAETALTAGLFAAELTGDLPALRTVAEAARRRNLIAIAKEAEAVPSKALSNWSKHLTGAAMILFAMMFSLHTSTAQAAETHKHATEQLTPASSFHNALHADVIAMVIEEIFATKKAETYTNLGPTLAPIRREGTYAVTRPVIQR